MTGAVVAKQLRKAERLGGCPLCEYVECDVFDATPKDCIDYVWPYFIEPSTVEVPDGEE